MWDVGGWGVGEGFGDGTDEVVEGGIGKWGLVCGRKGRGGLKIYVGIRPLLLIEK